VEETVDEAIEDAGESSEVEIVIEEAAPPVVENNPETPAVETPAAVEPTPAPEVTAETPVAETPAAEPAIVVEVQMTVEQVFADMKAKLASLGVTAEKITIKELVIGKLVIANATN